MLDMSWYARSRADLFERTQKYTPTRHCILASHKTALGRWLERNRTRLTDALFLYFHRNTHNYVVGKWTNPSAGLFKDMFILGRSPWNFMEGDMTALAAAISPTTPEKAKQFTRWLDRESAKEQNEDWSHDEATRCRLHKKKPLIVVP